MNNLRMVINYKNSFSEDMCSERGTDGKPISFMETGEDGFIGAYNPPPDYMVQLLEQNDKGSYSTNVSLGTRLQTQQRCDDIIRQRLLPVVVIHLYVIYACAHACCAGEFRRRRLLADSTFTNISGIYNPTICLQYDELMFFYVSNEHYPVYDSYVYDAIT